MGPTGPSFTSLLAHNRLLAAMVPDKTSFAAERSPVFIKHTFLTEIQRLPAALVGTITDPVQWPVLRIREANREPIETNV